MFKQVCLGILAYSACSFAGNEKEERPLQHRKQRLPKRFPSAISYTARNKRKHLLSKETPSKDNASKSISPSVPPVIPENFYYTPTLRYYVEEMYGCYVPECFPTYDKNFAYATALLHACFAERPDPAGMNQLKKGYAWDAWYGEDLDNIPSKTLSQFFAETGIQHFSEKLGRTWLSRCLKIVHKVWKASLQKTETDLDINSLSKEDIEYYFGLLNFLKTRFSVTHNPLLILSDISAQRFQETLRHTMVFKKSNLVMLLKAIEKAKTPFCFVMHFNVLSAQDKNFPLLTQCNVTARDLNSPESPICSDARSQEESEAEPNIIHSSEDSQQENTSTFSDSESKSDRSDLQDTNCIQERTVNSLVSTVWYRKGFYTYFNPSLLKYITCTKKELIKEILMEHGAQFKYLNSLITMHGISHEPVAPKIVQTFKPLTSAYYTDYVETYFSETAKLPNLSRLFFSRLHSEKTVQNAFIAFAKNLQYDLFDPKQIHVAELSLLSKKVLCAFTMFSEHLFEVTFDSMRSFSALSTVDLQLDPPILKLAHSWKLLRNTSVDARHKNTAAQMDEYFNRADTPLKRTVEKI